MRVPGGLVGLLTFSFWGIAWAGFDTSYNDFLLGQRAAGMGGAFTALANDPSASFYNPAGFAGFQGMKVGINLALQGFEYRHATAGLARDAGGVALDRLEFVLFPSITGVASHFGSKDKRGRPVWGGGFTFMVPTRTQVRFRGGLTEITGTQQLNAMFALQRDGQTFLAGPSIARRFGPVSVGLSALYAHRFFSWLQTNNVSHGSCKPTNLHDCTLEQGASAISSVEGWVGGLNFRLGLLIKMNPQWQIGAMASFSSIRLWGEGSFMSHSYGLNKDPMKPSSSRFEALKQLLSHSPMPWEVRVGLSYRPFKQLLLALDLAFYAPMSYRLLDSQKILDLFQYPSEVKRQAVLNVHLGLEWALTPRIPFRFGFFTNLSSAPDIPEQTEEPFLTKVHMVGISTSLGIKFGRTTFDLGVSGSYGGGDFQRLRSAAKTTYERVPLHQVFIYIYLSGATEFLEHSLKHLLKHVPKKGPLSLLRLPPPRKAPKK